LKKVKEYYHQRLPHIQPLGATFFITFRLFGSVPKVELNNLKQRYNDKLLKLNAIDDSQIRNKHIYQLRQDHFLAQENLLESINTGPHHLKLPEVANVVKDEIHRFDGKFYKLICHTIMSNHVHLVIDTSLHTESETLLYSREIPNKQLDVIMKRIKGPTAVKANRILREIRAVLGTGI
jgi:putative transposase